MIMALLKVESFKTRGVTLSPRNRSTTRRWCFSLVKIASTGHRQNERWKGFLLIYLNLRKFNINFHVQ